MDELTIVIRQKIWHIRRPGNLEDLWNAMGEDEFGEDERLPYWVEVWPASLVLGEWLLEKSAQIRDIPCLDIGCGLGLTSLVAATAGARVVAMDYEKDALGYAHQNALVNKVHREPLWVVADWRFPSFAPLAFPVMWAGDIVYEKRFIEPVTNCILHCLHPDGVMWLAEPNRTIYRDFLIFSRALGLICTKVKETRITAPEGHKVSVNIWEIRKE